MRLWHYKLIPYLPKQQLIAQWRELNSIYKKQDKHILINYIYDYDRIELLQYSILVINELKARNIQIKNTTNFTNYFGQYNLVTFSRQPQIFKNHHTEEYLKICCWNLYEKYIRGQAGFTTESINYITSIIK